MGKRFWVAIATCVASCVGSAGALGQEGVLNELYGKGVHAFFANDEMGAVGMLTRVIDAGSADPRAYFFRGVAAARRGDTYAAQEDFRRGAELEVSGINPGIKVGRALERVQGSVRLMIEDARREARLKARNVVEERRRLRYDEFQKSETEGLRKPLETMPPVKPTPPKAAPPKPVDPPKPKPADPDPFDGDAEPAEEMPDEPTADEPSSEEPTAEEPGGDEPSAEEPAEEMSDEPAGDADAPAAEDDDPFGS